jgi:hypothetical protein
MKKQNEKKYTCPGCGYLVFAEPSGMYDICPICGWQDDSGDLEEMYKVVGPNKMPLYDIQRNGKRCIWKSALWLKIKNFLTGRLQFQKDPQWRLLDKSIDVPCEPKDSSSEEVYYWLKNKTK